MKDVVGVGESLTKIVALVVAGIWTYWLFVSQRQRYPRAAVTLAVSDRRLPDNRWILHVSARIANIGNRLIRIEQMDLLVQRVAPLNDRALTELVADHDPLDSTQSCDLPWHRIGHRRRSYALGAFEIEPGEFDECHYDFVLRPAVSDVRVGVHVVNREKRTRSGKVSIKSTPKTIGWAATVFHRLGSGNQPHQPSVSGSPSNDA